MIKLKHLLENKDSKHAAGIAYVFNNELLCVQDTRGKWGIPKGHRHVGETPEEGALREFTEETSIYQRKKIMVIFMSFIVKGIKNLQCICHMNT